MQHVAREHRHDHEIGKAEDAEQRHEQDQSRYAPVGAYERDRFGEPRPDGPGPRGPGVGRQPHRQEPRDDREVADAVHEEARPHAQRSDQHARHRGTDHASRVERRRVECDRVHQVFFADQVHDERLPGRDVERIDDAEKGGEGGHVPHDHRSAPHEQREREGREHGQRLRDDDEAVLVGAIDEHAGVEREQQHAERAQRGDQTDVEGRIRQLEDQPPLRDVLHPGADEGHALSEEEKPEVAVGERPKGPARGVVHCGKARRLPIFRVGSR